MNQKKEIIIGPQRVLPGRLSVSRTFGDLEAKIERRGGNRNVVVSIPDIKSFRIQEDHDFIVMASDGIFDKISNKEAIECVWNSVRDAKSQNIHQQIGLGVEYIIKNALLRRTLDNVTVVLIAFDNFYKQCFGVDYNYSDSTIDNNFEVNNSSHNNSSISAIKKRNPQTNNTHTCGVIDKSKPHLMGSNGTVTGQLKSGIQTPTNGYQVNILDKGMKSNNISYH